MPDAPPAQASIDWRPLDALQLADRLRERLVELHLSEHYVPDDGLRRLLRSIWSGPGAEGGLVGELWVEGAFPFLTSDSTLDDLVRSDEVSGELVDQLARVGAFPRDLPLYSHQLAAIRAARGVAPDGGRPSVVVSSPTGSGKTEAFLLPLLSRLFERPREPGAGGVRAILLYPLNALVNDQVERMYGWLHGQERVRLFHFTSETPEDARTANKRGWPRYDACRFRTRRHARGIEDAEGRKTQGGPVPDVIITNYSMLEYMLCRPQDAVFFGSALESIVLDEAHLYTGTLAAEISLLLRRVLERCGREPRDVLGLAVSATIGGDDAPLQRFVGDLFSRPPDAVAPIRGASCEPELAAAEPSTAPGEEAARRLADEEWLTRPTLRPGLDEEGEPVIELARADAATVDELAGRLEALVAAPSVREARERADGLPARLLQGALRHAPLAQQLAQSLAAEPRVELTTLAAELFPSSGPEEALRATVGLLQLTAAARLEPKDHPLVPHRLHVVARGPDGLAVCLDPACSGPAERRPVPDRLGSCWPGAVDCCPACQGRVLTLAHCGECGEPALAASDAGGVLLPCLGNELPAASRLAWSEPAALEPDDVQEVRVDPQTARVRGPRSEGTRLYQVGRCPRCRAEGEPLRAFASAGGLVSTVVAETVLAGLPTFPDSSQAWLPARGRRLLAFSDSRSQAARLGPSLRVQHEARVVRSAIARIVSAEAAPSSADLEPVRAELARVEAELAGDLTAFARRVKEGQAAASGASSRSPRAWARSRPGGRPWPGPPSWPSSSTWTAASATRLRTGTRTAGRRTAARSPLAPRTSSPRSSPSARARGTRSRASAWSRSYTPGCPSSSRGRTTSCSSPARRPARPSAEPGRTFSPGSSTTSATRAASTSGTGSATSTTPTPSGAWGAGAPSSTTASGSCPSAARPRATGADASPPPCSRAPG